MTSRQPQVFISYQRIDGDFARQVREQLMSHGVRTWMDQYDIPAGAYWPDEIDAGLAASDTVVGIVSPDAVSSRNVKNEWDWALEHNKPLVLLMRRPTDVPHRYVSINFLDATDPDPAAVLRGLLQMLGVPAVTQEPAAATQVTVATPRHSPLTRGARRRVKPLVLGREREQVLLTRQLEEAVGGHGDLLVISGEAGIGKTTLTRWLLAEAAERGAVVLSGGCYDLTTTPPYGPWIELLRDWSADDRLPQLSETLRPGSSLTGVGSQHALFESVADMLAAGSAAHALVLLLEDLHWTDQASLDLLRHVARLVGDWRILLVVTYRDDDLTRRHPLLQALPVLVRESDAIRMTLARLDQAAISALIDVRYPLMHRDRERLVAHVARHLKW